MSDLIRRKDAIEVVYELVPIRNDAVEIADAIRAIPSAERKGEWEIVGRKYFRRICPFCKRPRAFRDSMFCDWCGADMRGTEDGR